MKRRIAFKTIEQMTHRDSMGGSQLGWPTSLRRLVNTVSEGPTPLAIEAVLVMNTRRRHTATSTAWRAYPPPDIQ